MKIQIYFLRHGQTTHSKTERFCGSGTEAELTNEGHEMARCFSNVYRNFPWTRIYCSPQLRARTTIKPLCDELKLEPQIRDGLREINYGVWEGKSLEEVYKEFGKVSYDNWVQDPLNLCPPQGETAREIAERSLAVIDEIKKNHTEGNFLLVSHKATIRLTLCALLGIDLARFRQRIYCPVASISNVELSSSGAMLKSLGDVSHLDRHLRELPGS